VGPRYIAAAVPFLFVPLVRLWPQIARRWWAVAGLVGLTIASVVLNVVSGALYPHYPEALRNPVFQLAFPLLGDGYAGSGLGLALGLRGAAALLPVALVVALALAPLVAGRDGPTAGQRLRQAGMALGVAALFLVSLGCYARRPTPVEQHALAMVRELWEPAQGIPDLHRRP
ncbi:MAG TPA: hypothetical protein VN962_19980, partial [Polyangia bacterium]|nr:hypothetical protein [Polyangia bacterium]